MCDKDVCERWCVTLCVCVTKLCVCVCDKDVCEVCDKAVCVCVTKLRVPISARPAMQNEGGCRQVQCLPRKTKVNVAKRNACHVKRRWVSPSATPAT